MLSELAQIQKEVNKLETFIDFICPVNQELASQELKELEQAIKENKKAL